MLTVAMVAQALPITLRSAVDQALVDKINNITNDPVMAEHVRDNFISYTKVLADGRFKTEDYLHAVTYVSFKLMGMTNQDAYFRTFPQRHSALVAKGTSQKDISAYVSAFNKGKLVNLIMEQTLVPTWVLNQDVYQKAINVQAELMVSANSEMVRMQAANSILTNLAKPKEAGPLINIDMTENAGMVELRELMMQVAKKQVEAIENGASTKEIAGQRIIENNQ